MTLARLPRAPAAMFGAGRSLTWLLDSRVAERPNKPFLVWEPFEERPRVWTYAEFGRAVAAVATGLRRRGVKKGDPVLIHLENCPEFLFAWFACARIGALAVSTNTRSSADEVAYFANHCRAGLAVTQTSLAAQVEAAMPHARAILLVDDEEQPIERSFSLLLGEVPLETPEPVAALDPASVQYTSGTTGRPKAVVWTHANLLWGAKVNSAHEGLSERDISLVYPPLFHTNAQSYSVLATLWVGATIVLQPRFSSSRFWNVSLRNKCTFASQLYFTLRALNNIDKPTCHSYRLWGTGMSSHPIAEEKFGVPTIGWWGMTETISHPIIGDVFMPNRPRTIGRVAPEYEVAVVRPDGSSAAAGETGELLVHGIPGVSLFAGYLHDPKATEAAFDKQGWFQSGDLVTLTDDGSFIFADRSKDILKVGAENVASSEIERVVMTVDGVSEAAVVGRPDSMLDEVPVVFVLSPRPDDALAANILSTCREKLADFKVPREVRFVDNMPRATLEKVAKQKLREILRAEAK